MDRISQPGIHTTMKILFFCTAFNSLSQVSSGRYTLAPGKLIAPFLVAYMRLGTISVWHLYCAQKAIM